MGDLLCTVDNEPIRGLEIPDVVRKIVGPPNSRVTLGIQRPRQSVHIPPPPVVISPFQQIEIVLRRELTSRDARDSKVAGVGIHFQKVVHNMLSIFKIGLNLIPS